MQMNNTNPESLIVKLASLPREDQSFQQILKTMTQFTEMPVGVISLFSKAQSVVFASLAHGYTPQIEQLDYFNKYIRKNKRMLLIKDTTYYKYIEKSNLNLQLPIFYCGVPIYIDHAVIGSLAVMDFMPRHLKKNHLDLMNILASSISAQWELKFKQEWQGKQGIRQAIRD